MKMQDKIEYLGKSTIHHGKFNNRLYLMKLAPENVPAILSQIDELTNEKGYKKIIAKIQSDALPHFISNNYTIEAYIPGFYKNHSDCLFVSKFKDENRKQIPKNELTDFYQLLNTTKKPEKLNGDYALKSVPERLGPKDAGPITEIFRQVFKTYPFPVHNPEYILETMRGNKTRYFGVREGKKLIGVSTAETDMENQNAEMTDFAVLPGYRGQNLAFRLLMEMEHDLKYANIKTAYTIARLREPGMSKTFMKSGYKFTGTLANNTNIAGNIESMNIFYKHL